MKEALYYSIYDEKTKTVKCFLCPNKCIIKENEFGTCLLRKNISGKLYAMGYGKVVSIALDPIEKKPLYHFFPGTKILSIGLTGCNFKCTFCQNADISQKEFDENILRNITSSDLISLAKQYDSIGIAYTYNEPLINYEFLFETAIEFNKNGLKNVLVSNGYIEEQPLINLLKYIDAANIDVKAFNQKFYSQVCKGRLDAVLRTCEILVKNKKHLEITNLLIPGLNDKEEEIKDMVDWIYSLSENIPLHFSKYSPNYKMTINSTPFKTLEKARNIAIKKLKFVYLGNVFEEEFSNTYCPFCKNLLIERQGYNVKIKGLSKNICKNCNNEVPVIVE